MSDTHFTYSGYYGSVQCSIKDGCLYGKIMFINDTVLYEGENIPKLEKAFKKAVKDYLDTCKRHGLEPQKPFKGSLNVRLGEDLHREVALQAELLGISINDWLKNVAKEKLERQQLEAQTVSIDIRTNELAVVEKVGKYRVPEDNDREYIVKEDETVMIEGLLVPINGLN